MATEVKLPRLGQGMEAGTIVRWLKAEGDEVAKGEPLFELDTDKVTQEVEADAAGVLLKIVVPEGEANVGATVAVIGSADEDVGAPDKRAGRKRGRTGDTDRPADRCGGTSGGSAIGCEARRTGKWLRATRFSVRGCHEACIR